jgi:endonuclease/exonuclease/phosphatase (EEP) superfamily protein YafD
VRVEADEVDRGAVSRKQRPPSLVAANSPRRLAKQAGWALDAAVAAMAGTVVLQLVLGVWAWPFTFVLHFFEASAPLWVLGFTVALMRHSRWRLVVNGGGLVAWCIVCGPRLVRAVGAESARTAGECVVMTLNAGNGCASPEQLCAALRASDADIVFLQELAQEHADAIGRASGIPFPHRALFPGGIPGKGVLARHPLRDVRLVHADDGTKRVHGILAFPGGDIEFVDVHANMHVAFLGPLTQFDEQVLDLARDLPRERPVIVAGDFNLTTSNAILDPLRAASFREAFVESGAGLGLSFPLFGRYRGLPLPPVVRIDHIWFRGLECVAARLGEDAGSDHLPLRARFVRR